MVFKNLFTPRKAPLWRRVFAYVIDLIVLAIILSPLDNFEVEEKSVSSFYQLLINNPSIANNFLLTTLISSLITLIYFCFLEFNLKQTLGKMIMHIEVKSLKKELAFSQILLRNITKVSPIILLIEYVFAGISHTHQRFTEKLSNTEVIEKWVS